MRGPRGHPLLVEVVVDHDGGARGGDALLWPFVTENKKERSYLDFHGLHHS